MKVGTWARGLGLGLAAASCGGGGGGGSASAVVESEGNGTFATASVTSLGRPGSGSLDSTGDVDFWSLSLGANELVELELFATRLDQARWDTVVNAPRLTLYDVDGVTKLLEHDLGGFTSNGWGWGVHDLDVPLFRAPASGTYYVALRQDDGTKPGGDYAFVVRRANAGILQAELESAGTTGMIEGLADSELGLACEQRHGSGHGGQDERAALIADRGGARAWERFYRLVSEVLGDDSGTGYG